VKIDNWLLYGLFSFYATLGVYNGQRLFKLNRKSLTPWLQWVKKYQRSLFILSILSSLLAGIIVLKIGVSNTTSWMLLLASTFVSLFYVIRVFGKNFREIPMLKIHLIALTWVSVLILFPLLNEGALDQSMNILVAHYLYIVAVTIPFDIRDLKYDDITQRTIPQMIGVRAAKVLSFLLLVTFALLMFFSWVDLRLNLIFYLGVIIQLFLVFNMNEKRSDLYCAGWIDGSIAIIGISYFM